ncbi:MAG: hypothetical protein DRP22_00780 [Verrucomicrobia bacterium]|nr:MAG: hypothetical protein DRP22_00780 [Verrucomicrobiota bacterium]
MTTVAGRISQCRWLPGAIALLTAWLVGVSPAAEEAGEVIQGFTVPDYDSEGNLRSELLGDRAVMLPSDLVRIENLEIRFYSEGKLTMRVMAPECIYDRKHKEARSEGPVRIALENMIVTGKGFRWSQGKQRLEIFSSSKVVLKGVGEEITERGRQ